MNLILYADDCYAKSYKMVAVYDEAAFNDIFIEKFDPSIFHSLQKYRAMHPHVDVSSIAFKAQFLAEIQNISEERKPCFDHITPANVLLHPTKIIRQQTFSKKNHHPHCNAR